MRTATFIIAALLTACSFDGHGLGDEDTGAGTSTGLVADDYPDAGKRSTSAPMDTGSTGDEGSSSGSSTGSSGSSTGETTDSSSTGDEPAGGTGSPVPGPKLYCKTIQECPEGPPGSERLCIYWTADHAVCETICDDDTECPVGQQCLPAPPTKYRLCTT